MVQPERVADTHNHTGEGPLWHPDEERLYWVDIPAGQLFAYNPATNKYDISYETEGDPIGGYTIESDGSLLLFTQQKVERLTSGSDDTSVIAEIDADTRFNDVIADPEGRVFCGTMPSNGELGDLYRLDTDGTAVVVEDVDIPNGMGFSRDLKTFYFTESEARRIYAFDYDRATGELSNERTFREIPEGDGIPDGMTVDADNHVWSARWNGNRVVRYTLDGESVSEIELPARKVSSVTFGGPDYSDLYLTTALADGDRSTEGDGAGELFRVSDIGVSGTPEFRSRIA